MRLSRCFIEEEIAKDTWRQIISQRPVAWQKNGAWLPIKNEISADGHFGVGATELIDVSVRPKYDSASADAHIRIGDDIDHISFAPVSPKLSVKPQGVISENKIKFPGCWPGADLEYVLAGHQIQKNIYLHDGHPRIIAFIVKSHSGFDPKTLSIGQTLKILQPLLYNPMTNDVIRLQWDISQVRGNFVLSVRLPGDFSGWILDPTTTLQPGAAGYDTYCISTTANTNYGTAELFGNGDWSSATAAIVSFIKFDLSSIPSGHTVSDATLALYEYDASDVTGVGSWATNLHRLLRDWVEGEATWNIYSTGNSWTTAGAKSDGNDRDADVSAAVTLDGTAAAAFVEWNAATLTDDVGKMVAGTYSNYGWVIESPNAEYQGTDQAYNAYRSSDYGTSSDRPKLTVIHSSPSGIVPRVCFF